MVVLVGSIPYWLSLKRIKNRLCLDRRRANEAIIREKQIIPKGEDILTELHGAKVLFQVRFKRRVSPA